MKFIIFTIIITILSCQEGLKIKCHKKNKTINLVEKDTLCLSKREYNKITFLRRPAKEIAIYYLTNKDKYTSSQFTFKCGTYELWIGNGLGSIHVHSPINYTFNQYEKRYFWEMYKNYQENDMILYDYENNVEIILND